MIHKYLFFNEKTIEFDSTRTIKELIEYAFEQFEYYEPFGIETVTVYQCDPRHQFIVDTSQKCEDVLADGSRLCFAYHIPGVLYYAEGGWGHHMHELVNHPVLETPVSLKLKFEEFDHTVVFEGSHSFREILNLLYKVGYIENEKPTVTVQVLAYPQPNYSEKIYFDNSILDKSMTDFEKTLDKHSGIVTLVIE